MTWYVAVLPAATVCAVLGLTLIEKSVTLTASAFELLVDDPAEVTMPLFEKTGEAVVGVIVTVTVAVAPVVNVPIEQTTVVPLGEPQVPGLLLIEPKVAPLAGRLSVKTIPVAGSVLPFLTMYLNVTGFPTPTVVAVGAEVGSMATEPEEPILLMKASVAPPKLPW